MASKRKFKRDYIMLEAKDMNYRFKDKVSPKAFAKIEMTDEKSVIALYAENLKHIDGEYSVVAIRSDYDTMSLGSFNVNNQGKGEFSIDLGSEDIDIKGIAIIDDNSVPLIGFKGTKIDNFKDILFPPEYSEEEEVEEDNYEDDEDTYEEIEYIEVDDDGRDDVNEDNDDYEYEEVEYIEVDEDDNTYEGEEENNYEEIEYLTPDDLQDSDSDEYEYEEIIYEEIEDNEYEDNTKPEEAIVEERKNIKQKDYSYIDNKINKTKSVLEKKNTSKKYTSVKSEPVQGRVAGPLLMPRQIKKGLKYFNEVKPFVSDYIEKTRWWKIEISPTTLCGYTMPYLGYINTLNYTMYSDAVMQAYKYRHYLFGVQYDEYNKRQYYIYAVPGKKVEQPDKGHTGFTRYQSCDVRNNSLGYWLCFVDCKARKIVK